MITRIKELWHNLAHKFLQSIYELLFGNEVRKGVLIHVAYFFILSFLVFICVRTGLKFWEDFLATVAAFLISAIIIYICRTLLQYFEDSQKVHYDDSFMKQLYGAIDDNVTDDSEKGYHRQFRLGEGICRVYYDCCLDTSTYNGVFTVSIDDDPDKIYEPPQFVRDNVLEIMKAHENSYFGNWDTVRLDGYEIIGSKLIARTSRSTYFSHLLTNRAIDYRIAEQISLRQMFEYRDKLSSLETSIFSNHLGMLGIIVLDGGYTLFPHRANSSTISKNMITSGLAAALIHEEPSRSLSSSSTEAPFKDFILKKLPAAMKIPEECLYGDNSLKHEVSVRFLGFGRDVYEGGKPSFFYLIRVKMSVEEYFACHDLYKDSDETKIDRNKKVYVVKYDTIRWHKQGSFLSFMHLTSPDSRLKEKYVLPEKNLLCNLYHCALYGKSRQPIDK